MKRILVAVLLLGVLASPAIAQNGTEMAAEREGVIAAALDYMEGALTADADRMARAVHPGLTKVVVSTNRQTGRQSLSYNTGSLLVEWVRGIGDRFADVDKNVVVTVLDIGDSLATARAIGEPWYDFMQMAKINGEWRIVNVLWARNRLEAEDQMGVTPDARDSANVVAAALNYIDGSFSGDAGRMESALHPELTKMLLTYDRTTGQPFLHKMGASDLIEGTRAGMGMVDEAERDIEVVINDISHGYRGCKGQIVTVH